MTGPDDLQGTGERLRAALSDHAQSIEPSGDGLQRIEERLMETPPTADRRNGLMIGAAAVVALLIGVVTFVAVSDSDDSDVVADSDSTTTTAEPTTTTDTSETTTSEAPFTSTVDPYAVAYPGPMTSQRFDQPEPAAAAYARDVLGFTELVTADFQSGDSRSSEVVVSDREGGPETTILLRRMEDDAWYVLGSQTDNITVDAPVAGDALSSPFETTGEALAFEGTVDVVVAPQDDVLDRESDGFVTGSGVPPAGPFSGTIEFVAPSDDAPGILVYRVLSPEDGHVTEATSFPVRLVAA